MTLYFSFGVLLGTLFILGGAFWLGIQTAMGNVQWQEDRRFYSGWPPKRYERYDGPRSLAFILLVGAVGFALAWPALIALGAGFGVVRLAHLAVKRDDDEASS